MNQELHWIVWLTLAMVPLLMAGLLIALFASLFSPWMRAVTGGAPVPLIRLLGMRLRGTPPSLIVDALVTLAHRGHPHGIWQCGQAESIYLAQRGLIRSPEQLADLVEKQTQAEPKPVR